MSQLLNGQFMNKGLAIAVTTFMVGTAHAAKTEQQQIQELRQEGPQASPVGDQRRS